MRTSRIYQVKIDFGHPQFYLKGSKPHLSYYSNLSRAASALTATLVINNWNIEGLNYTAMYRSIRQKGSFIKQIRKGGVSFFRVEITELILNPGLNTFDLEPAPD